MSNLLYRGKSARLRRVYHGSDIDGISGFVVLVDSHLGHLMKVYNSVQLADDNLMFERII
jgi:hypothetical protein